MMQFSDKVSLIVEVLDNVFYDTMGGLIYDEDENNDFFVIETIGFLSYKIHVMYRKGYVSCFLAYGKCEISLGSAVRPLAELESLLAEVKAELHLRLGRKFVPRDYVPLCGQIRYDIPMNVVADNLALALQRCFGSYVSDTCREWNNEQCYGRYYRLCFNLYDTYPLSAYGDQNGMVASLSCLEADQEAKIPVFSYNVMVGDDSFDLEGFARKLQMEIESRLPDKFLRQRAAAGEGLALVTAPGEETAPSGPRELRDAAGIFFGSRFADGQEYSGGKARKLLHPVDNFRNRRDYGLFNPPRQHPKGSEPRHPEYAVRFSAYATVPVVFACHDGMLDAYLYYGKYLVPINPRRLPMPASRMTEFFRLVKEELELRLPDEFLAKYGWLE